MKKQNTLKLKKINYNNKIKESYEPILDIETIQDYRDESQELLQKLIVEEFLNKYCNTKEKVVINLTAFGYTLEEVSKILNIPFKQVKSLYTNGIMKMRRHLYEY